jgi:hypothetical protein
MLKTDCPVSFKPLSSYLLYVDPSLFSDPHTSTCDTYDIGSSSSDTNRLWFLLSCKVLFFKDTTLGIFSKGISCLFENKTLDLELKTESNIQENKTK